MNVPRPLVWSVAAIPWIVVVLSCFAFLVQRFPPSGVVHFRFSHDGSSPWLTAFLPGQRVTSPGVQPDGWTGQRILGSPVYASLRTPGVYDSVSVGLEFRPQNQPLIEIGIERDAATQAFELRPLWSEALSQGWRHVTVGSRSGFVREEESDAIILTDKPEELLVWYATSTVRLLSDAAGSPVRTEINLRGSHDFHLVPAGGVVDLTFEIQDANRSRNGNAAVFRITKGDELVASEALGTGGSADRRMGEVATKRIRLDDLSPGVYQVSFLADDDIFIRAITTTAKHWVIGPRLYLADAVGWRPEPPKSVLWTNSQHIVAETFHNEGLQAVQFGQRAVTLAKTHQPYPMERAAVEREGSVRLEAPKSDVRLIGDGYFAVDPSALYLPKPRRLTDASRPLEEGIRAVLTPYRGAAPLSDGWLVATTTFALDGMQDRPRLTLSLPGILGRQATLDIRAATLEYQRPPLSWDEWWQVVKRELVSVWRRI